MSAAEVIEQIKALPPAEKAQVLDFVRTLPRVDKPVGIEFASDEQAKEAGDRVVKQYEEVFRKLSQ
jgi:hypothetical protein